MNIQSNTAWPLFLYFWGAGIGGNVGMCGLGLVLKNNSIDTKVNDGSANMNHLLRMYEK